VTGANAFVWSVGAQATLDGLTITRIRGEFSVWLESIATVFDGYNQVAIGICNINENAAGVGITAIPFPLDDSDWDGWMFHSFLGSLIGFSVTETGQSAMEVIRVPIDSKAMRKVHEGDTVVGVVQFGIEQGVAVAEFSANTRILDFLP